MKIGCFWWVMPVSYTHLGEGVYNLYPLFDWKTEDIWIANGKFRWDYNKLYDLYYKADSVYTSYHPSPSIGVNDFIQGKALNGLTDEWTCQLCIRDRNKGMQFL